MGYVGEVKVGSTTHLVGSTLYGTCSTAAKTAAKVVTCTNFDTLITGVTIHVKFTYGNTAAGATLNVNNTGAKIIRKYKGSNLSNVNNTSWTDGSMISFTYDGAYWVMNDCIGNDELTLTAGKCNVNQLACFVSGCIGVITGVVKTTSPINGNQILFEVGAIGSFLFYGVGGNWGTFINTGTGATYPIVGIGGSNDVTSAQMAIPSGEYGVFMTFLVDTYTAADIV